MELLLGILGLMFISKVESFAEYLFTLIVLSSVVAMAFIDHKYRKLPHALSYSTIIIALIYITVYGSPYYQALEAFALLPNALAKLFTALSFFGLTIISLDCFTHLMNLIYFRARALRITPQALCFNNQFLIKHVTYLYLLLAVIEIALIYKVSLAAFYWFNLGIGISYFINEICIEYLFNSSLSEKLPDARHASSEPPELTETSGQSVFGGGDTILVSLAAVLLGTLPALTVLLASFYLALIYFVGLKIFSRLRPRLVSKPSDEACRIDEKYIPLGGALSIAIIAAMMILG